MPDIDLGPNEYRGGLRAKEGCFSSGGLVRLLVIVGALAGIVWFRDHLFDFGRSIGLPAFAGLAVIVVALSLAVAALLDRQRARRESRDGRE